MNKYLLLSIQPRIMKEIVQGTKKFEFRKKLPNLEQRGISTRVVMYCSSPVMQIYGSFKIGRYVRADFEKLMIEVGATEKYKNRISKYFNDKSDCHAMSITELKIYDKPLTLSSLRIQFPGFVPGQSYRYLDNKIAELIIVLNGSL